MNPEVQNIVAAGKLPAADGEKLQMEVDREVNDKLLITAAPDGYLKRI